MKKTIMTLAIVLGLSLTTFADGGGLFLRGAEPNGTKNDGTSMPGLPGHGATGNQDAPVGAGVALLTAFGAAYLIGKRPKKD